MSSGTIDLRASDEVVWHAEAGSAPTHLSVVDGRVQGHAPDRSDGDWNLNAEGCVVLPGFIDQHIHGIDGHSFVGHESVEPCRQALEAAAIQLPRYGVTAFLPTTVTEGRAPTEVLATAITTMVREPAAATPLGMHLEGPFLAHGACGAHDQASIEPVSAESLQWIAELGKPVRAITAAPEVPGFAELCDWSARRGVALGIGHSLAESAEAREAVESGATCVTHLFNAMGGLDHRRSSVASYALATGTVCCELIADTFMVATDWIELAVRRLTPARIILVSDALEGSGRDGSVRFTLCGTEVIQQPGGLVRREDGAVWGSRRTIVDAVVHMRRELQLDWTSIARMSSGTCAERLGSGGGRISIGEWADLVLLDGASLEIVATVCRGEVAYCADTSRMTWR